MKGDDLLNIGAFAAATGRTVPALRHYDGIGLLKPARVDPDTGYRRYRRGRIDDARLICGLRAVVSRTAGQMRPALEAHRRRP